MTPSVHPDDEQLTAYVLGDLPAEHLPLIAAHVAECGSCVNLMQAAQATGELLRQVRVPVIPDEMRNSILASFNPQAPVHVDPTPSAPIPVPPPVAIPGAEIPGLVTAGVHPDQLIGNPFPGPAANTALPTDAVVPAAAVDPAALPPNQHPGGITPEVPASSIDSVPISTDAYAQPAEVTANTSASIVETGPIGAVSETMGDTAPFSAQPPAVYSDGTMSVHAETDQLNSADIRNAGALSQPMTPLAGQTPGFQPLPRPQSAPIPAAQVYGKPVTPTSSPESVATQAEPARWRHMLGVAASLLVIGFFGIASWYLLASQVQPSGGITTASNDAAEESESAPETMSDSRTETNGADIQPLPAGKTPVFATDTEYSTSSLADDARALLDQAGKVSVSKSGTVAVEEIDSGSTLLTDDGVARCMAAIDSAGTRPLAIDLATYNGSSAAILILPGRAGQYEAIVVQPTCAASADDLIKYEPFTN